MRTKTIQDIVNKLERMQKLGKSVIVFLGAGASVSAGIPTSKGMIEYISQEPDLSKLIKPDPSNYFEVMDQLDPAERRRILKNFVDQAKINETHLILAILVYLGYVDTVVTTNFDNLIEKSLSLFHQEINTIDISNNVNIDGHSISTPRLYYLHGRYNNVWQLNTREELNRVRPKLNSLISRLSINRFWLIIGYSGNDPVFDEFCRLEKFDEGLYWIGYKDQNPPSRVLKSLLNKPTKNAFFVTGYTSDSFFKSFYKKLTIDDIHLVEMLSAILAMDKLKPKLAFNNKHRLSNTNKTLISDRAITWINNLKSQTTGRKQPFSKYFGDRLIGWFRKLFTPTDPFVIDIQVNLYTKNYDTALRIVNSVLANDSSNYLAHYYKGLVLASQAFEMEPPSSRQPGYKKARSSWDRAKELMEAQEETPDTYDDLTNSVIGFWADEYNNAVNIQNEDSLFKAMENPYQTSLEHLQNAVIINPDNAMTYQVISSTYYHLDQSPQAIEAYEKAMKLLEQPKLEDFEYQISLYLYVSDYEKAIELSHKGLEQYPDEIMFVQFLADAYIQAGERETAISLVEDLIEGEPDNSQYRRVLGTQVYQDVELISNEVSDLYIELFELRQAAKNQHGQELKQTQAEIEDLQAQIDQREQQIEKLSAISIEQMKKVVELEPESESANFILGIIYQNRAANLFERRNNTTHNDMANEYDERAKENLRNAMQYYERAAEINPDNPENWNSLFQVYTALGMEEEAEEIMQKAGMDNKEYKSL